MYEPSWFTIDFLETLNVFPALPDAITFFLPVMAGVFLDKGIVAWYTWTDDVKSL